jgi:hypothetical protein
MPTLSLNDQHDKPAPVGPATRWVVFTAEKPVSDMVSAVLAAEPAAVVDRLRLVYVADISGMAKPSTYETFIHNTLPVLTGARRQT